MPAFHDTIYTASKRADRKGTLVSQGKRCVVGEVLSVYFPSMQIHTLLSLLNLLIHPLSHDSWSTYFRRLVLNTLPTPIQVSCMCSSCSSSKHFSHHRRKATRRSKLYSSSLFHISRKRPFTQTIHLAVEKGTKKEIAVEHSVFAFNELTFYWLRSLL